MARRKGMHLATRLSVAGQQQQRQSLALTGGMRTALDVLEMDAGGLQAFLAAEVAANPFLSFSMNASRSDGEDALISTAAFADDVAEIAVDDHPSLHEHLRSELSLQRISKDCRELALMLAGELDARGWLGRSLKDIAAEYQYALSAVEEALTALQRCDPTGIGARDLEECLRLQLQEQSRWNDDWQRLLPELPRLARTGVEGVVRATGLPSGLVEKMLRHIRTLEPRPARGFDVGVAGRLVAAPEIIATKTVRGEWQVDLARENMPKLRLKSAGTGHSDAKISTQEKAQLAAAKALMQAIERRGNTLLLLSREIIARQTGFLEFGWLGLRPLAMEELAELLDMHVSTVSRTIAGKRFSCPSGVFSLRSLLAQPVDEAGLLPAAAIRARIEQLIYTEDARKPLSDMEITRQLRVSGVAIARRTVAKYREDMRIPSSTLRRRR